MFSDIIKQKEDLELKKFSIVIAARYVGSRNVKSHKKLIQLVKKSNRLIF